MIKMISKLLFFTISILVSSAMAQSNLRDIFHTSTSIGSKHPLPLPVRGECTTGDQYTINSVNDLFKNIPKLECIFAAGITPPDDNIPLGYSYGYLLAAENTAFWDPIANLVYQGDFVVKTTCKGVPYYIGWLAIGGMSVGTAVWENGVAPFVNQIAEGEYPLGDGRGIIMDFTVDFSELCPEEGNNNFIGLKGYNPFTNSIWPIKNFIDLGRVVGRDRNDGAIITLNKAFIVSGEQAVTVLIYATKNFDPNILPDFAKTAGKPITVPKGPNGETVIKYNRSSVEGLVKQLSYNFNPFYRPKNSMNAKSH